MVASKKLTKNIVVTGGAGFIGSNLCNSLLKEDNIKVYCIDNFLTGNKKNIAPLFKNPNFEFIEHDIANPIDIDDDIHEIYNLACPASPIHYQRFPIETIKACTIGVINILELALKNNSKILQASTSEVYGDPKEHPQKESYYGNVNPVGLRSCYDEGKRCSETLFMDYHRKFNLKIKIVRIFNTYGPNMAINDGRVVSNFITQALTNNDITIYGDGSQTRSFQYIDDLILGIKLMMASHNRLIGPVNMGNPIEISINELCLKILDKLQTKSKINNKDIPSDDPKRRNPDISIAKKELNWNPVFKLEMGLEHTINYFKNKLYEKS